MIIPNSDLPFTLTTDASNIAIGAVLTQDHGRGQQPIAYFSRKLNEAQQKYEVQERELLAVKEAVTEWRSYLEGQKFTIKTNNRNLLTITTNSVQRNDKVIRWLQFLANFNYVVEHVKGSENRADILTRRSDYVLNTLQFPVTEQQFFDAVKLAYQVNPVDTKYTCTPDGLWINERGRIVIPDNKELRRFLIHEAHSTRYSGHFSDKKTIKKLATQFYWPGMYDDVSRYIRRCWECQRHKTGEEARQGELQPLPIPKRPWMDVAMDFVTHLPISQGAQQHDAILVVVDRLTKMAHFIPTWSTSTAPTMAVQFFNGVVKYHGLPLSIVSDRDPKFTSQFWQALHPSMGTRL